MAEVLKPHDINSSGKRLLSGALKPKMDTQPVVSNKDEISRSKDESCLVVDFEKEISEHKEEAYAEGFNKGYEDGQVAAKEDFLVQQNKMKSKFEEKEKELANKIHDMERLFENMQAALSDALNKTELSAVEIAFSGLAKLLGQADGYRARLEQQVLHAIDQFGHDAPVRILLNAEDAEILRNIEKLRIWSDRFVSEESLPRGGCIVEAGSRSMAAGLQEQLDILRNTLLKLNNAEI